MPASLHQLSSIDPFLMAAGPRLNDVPHNMTALNGLKTSRHRGAGFTHEAYCASLYAAASLRRQRDAVVRESDQTVPPTLMRWRGRCQVIFALAKVMAPNRGWTRIAKRHSGPRSAGRR